ncbi:transmembrane protein 255B-like isoform 2-T2 [Callospermophilus lateralis]|uniref:transmembrane protein 255B-like isoform X2 n=1 Tax=Callospermophilus lateralis TaxID=76772 RepID=UPI0040541D57
MPSPPVPRPLALLDTTGFARRKRTSLWSVGSLFLVSALILTIGLAATTRTENVTVGGYYPGIILGFGSFLGILGVNLVENRRQMLVAAIVFISFGVVAAFCCAVVDGVFAAQYIVSTVPTQGDNDSKTGHHNDSHRREQNPLSLGDIIERSGLWWAILQQDTMRQMGRVQWERSGCRGTH